MSDGISYREFGRQFDLSGQAVSKAVQTGRIPPEAVGEITLRSGRKRPCIIDPELAAKSMKLNTSEVFQRDKAKISEGVKRAKAGIPPMDSPQSDDSEPSSGRAFPTINESKAESEYWKAKLSELEYEEKSGLLVQADVIRAEVSAMVIAAKNKLMGVPSKAKSQMPHLTVGDIGFLENLISEALQELADG